MSNHISVRKCGMQTATHDSPPYAMLPLAPVYFGQCKCQVSSILRVRCAQFQIRNEQNCKFATIQFSEFNWREPPTKWFVTFEFVMSITCWILRWTTKRLTNMPATWMLPPSTQLFDGVKKLPLQVVVCLVRLFFVLSTSICSPRRLYFVSLRFGTQIEIIIGKPLAMRRELCGRFSAKIQQKSVSLRWNLPSQTNDRSRRIVQFT